MVDRKTTIWREMTRSGFIKYDISREVIFPSKVTNTLANPVVFIAYKNGLIVTRTAFGLVVFKEKIGTPICEGVIGLVYLHA